MMGNEEESDAEAKSSGSPSSRTPSLGLDDSSNNDDNVNGESSVGREGIRILDSHMISRHVSSVSFQSFDSDPSHHLGSSGAAPAKVLSLQGSPFHPSSIRAQNNRISVELGATPAPGGGRA